MDFFPHQCFRALVGLSVVVPVLLLLWRVLFSCYISPIRANLKLRRRGFRGPLPSFPLGNFEEMKMIKKNSSKSSLSSNASSLESISNDCHAHVFPHFACWQKTYGKVFVYWLGTEPFLYIADPEFLRGMSEGVMGKNWGKPAVFRSDREPMFGNGLLMVEGDDWVRHRHIVTPAFAPANLKNMTYLMVDCATKMLNHWGDLLISSSNGAIEIDVESEILRTTGEIIARTSFGGMSSKQVREAFDRLKILQDTLFRSTRYVGVPFSGLLTPKRNLETRRLGKEINELLLSIITARRNAMGADPGPQKDLLGFLLAERYHGTALTMQDVVDECKAFFFGGLESTALAITWTLLMLAVHPQWQIQLREEIRQVVGEGEVEFEPNMLAGLKKMGWVMNEVLRLYPPAPNAQRQTRNDIRVGELVIPNGTNIWIDLVSMAHDPTLWGDDVNEFKPERFKDDLYGGCKHKMGFVPFGFGGRMCVGRNLSAMEYKIVLANILTRFSFSLSPTYTHSPSYLLSLRPGYGLPLVLQPLTS